MYYAGVGSRSIPYEVLVQMTKIAERLAGMGYTLRTGQDINGADRAFRMGIENFHIHHPNEMPEKMVLYSSRDATPFAINIAKKYIRDWDNLDDGLKNHYAKSVMLLLGPDGLVQSKFLICWTPNGAESQDHVNRRSGNAGLCIQLARDYKIPVINLKRDNALDKLEKVLSKVEKAKTNSLRPVKKRYNTVPRSHQARRP